MQEQIGKMDVIYTNASLVIIAAAGATIDYGLPGVASRRRRQQPYALVGKDAFVSTLTDLSSILFTISWWSRSWCFQEALLSRRRLIFTDDKVYFFCRQMLSMETLSLPFYNPQERPLTSQVNTPIGFYEWLSGGGVGRSKPQQIYDILSEYARKDMSFESDGLNAIIGVLRAFSQASLPTQFHSYAGLPILGRPSRKAFLVALLWSAHITKDRRAGGFPSWSWVGWTGSFRYNQHSEKVKTDDEIRIRLVEQDGNTTSWKEFVSTGRLRDTVFPISQYIELYIQTVAVQLVHLASSRFQGGGAYVVPVQRLPEGKVRYTQVNLNYGVSGAAGTLGPELHAELVGKPAQCILPIVPDNEQKLYGNVWVLRCVGDHSEIVGIFQLDYMGDVYDVEGNYDSFLLNTDPKSTVEGFSDLERKWIRIG